MAAPQIAVCAIPVLAKAVVAGKGRRLGFKEGSERALSHSRRNCAAGAFGASSRLFVSASLADCNSRISVRAD